MKAILIKREEWYVLVQRPGGMEMIKELNNRYHYWWGRIFIYDSTKDGWTCGSMPQGLAAELLLMGVAEIIE